MGPLKPVPLLPGVSVVSGYGISHPHDANALLFEGAEPTLVDCGTAEGYPNLRRNLDRFDTRPVDIQKVLATHGHFDHVTGMSPFAKESGAKLFLHEADRAAVERQDPLQTATFLYEGRTFPAIQVDDVIHDGDVFRAGDATLRAIHTPGHSPGHVSFLAQVNDVKVLILGDAVGAHFNQHGSDFAAWKQTLGKLVDVAAEEKVDFMIAGHAAPKLLDDPQTRLAEAEDRFCGYLDPFFDRPGAQYKYGRP